MTENKALEELAKIDFPKPIKKEEIVEMLKYVSDKGKCDVSYNSIYCGTIDSGNLREYCLELKGIIRDGIISAEFYLERSFGKDKEEEEGLFGRLNLTAFGLQYDKISPQEENLWKNVDKYIKEFFDIEATNREFFGKR